MTELELMGLWALRDARYRALKRDGSATRFTLPEPKAVEAIRLWRVDEAANIGSDRLAELARTWTP